MIKLNTLSTKQQDALFSAMGLEDESGFVSQEDLHLVATKRAINSLVRKGLLAIDGDAYMLTAKAADTLGALYN